MPLLLSGRGFRRELESAGCMAVFAPLEGGAETRLLRRLRGAGYRTQLSSARGLGDPEVFLFQKHGFAPPTLDIKALVVVPLWERSKRSCHFSVRRCWGLSPLPYGFLKDRFCPAPNCRPCVTFVAESPV